MILAIGTLMWQQGAFSQDIHFSQIYEAPLLINPALTGKFNGDHRVILNYKDQWGSVTTGAPYRTEALSFDMGILKKKWDNSFLGAGLFLYNDQAGDTKMGTIKANVSLSGILILDNQNVISAGLQGGFAQRSVDASQMRWDNQFDGTGHNSALSSGEVNSYNESFLFGDAAAGISWSFGTDNATITSNDQFKVNAGLAFFHINRPKQKFGVIEKMYSKLIAHAGSHIGLKNTNIALKPQFLFMLQGPATEVNVGIMARYTIREESRFTGIFKETALSMGGYLRVGDAFVPAILFEMGSFAVGISYDINISRLTVASNARGGIEIMLRFTNPNPFRYGRGTKSDVKFL